MAQPAHDAPPAARVALVQDAPTFRQLGLHRDLERALDAAGYDEPTHIQTHAIPPALEGRDVVGCAATGTGKTAAFVLPMLQRLLHAKRAELDRKRLPCMLVLAPTRELAAQIDESIAVYGRFVGVRHALVVGGVSQQRQVRELRCGVDIVVATPGRLCDLLDQGYVELREIELLVLDEFDRMLDQGFLPAIRAIVRELPAKRQTLLYSATMPPQLESIVAKIVRDPARVTVGKAASTPERVDQSVCFVDQAGKRYALEQVLRGRSVTRAIVFTRTKHGANRVAEHLKRAGIDAEAIHGNKSQSARERTLDRFRAGSLPVLVATDLASRGIDVDDISHVVNYDLPVDPETYVHRIGRTARAGRSGHAISFCTNDERSTVRRIERLTGRALAPMARLETPPAPSAGQELAPPRRDATLRRHGRAEAPLAHARGPRR